MAVKYKELSDKLYKSPLSKDELNRIKVVEDYIDQLLILRFKDEPINIDLDVATFSWDKDKCQHLDLPTPRRKIMYNELASRYIEAGWDFTTSSPINYDTFDSRNKIIITGTK